MTSLLLYFSPVTRILLILILNRIWLKSIVNIRNFQRVTVKILHEVLSPEVKSKIQAELSQYGARIFRYVLDSLLIDNCNVKNNPKTG